MQIRQVLKKSNEVKQTHYPGVLSFDQLDIYNRTGRTDINPGVFSQAYFSAQEKERLLREALDENPGWEFMQFEESAIYDVVDGVGTDYFALIVWLRKEERPRSITITIEGDIIGEEGYVEKLFDKFEELRKKGKE